VDNLLNIQGGTVSFNFPSNRFSLNNTEPKLRPDTKFIDVKKIAQQKLNDFQFNELIRIHEQIKKSGTHNYLGCKIAIFTIDSIIGN
jgi:hypothetical protein